MSAKSARQIQCHACLRERRIHEPLVSRDEERIWFGQRRQALLVLDIPTGSLIFTAIFVAILAAHADPFLTVERRAFPPPLHCGDAASRVSTVAWRIQPWLRGEIGRA